MEWYWIILIICSVFGFSHLMTNVYLSFTEQEGSMNTFLYPLFALLITVVFGFVFILLFVVYTILAPINIVLHLFKGFDVE